ncbi:hypothetical protein [Spirilliplanes yamanashiensis]|uniref:Transmembrane protein n=1 Tax=Spirilliplanes yamanashiensis TaxID=42233 RepID=A0A8J3YCP0_9ACTN|nr:hypothetical protein [Spirilliplanes yamanashiensis]MDP9816723.1 putative membrane protein YfcA [Spirilliplanes yamanashiensis]GIJ06246.1 hypothetical protein Sya03_55980 [Spirilliplanes yamanashiensis]
MTSPLPPVPRVVGLVLASLVAVPLLGLQAYLLLWFSPEVTGSDACVVPAQCDPGGVRERAWWAVLAAFTAGAGCYAAAWVRMRRPARWWPWLVAAVAALLAGMLLIEEYL